jgi:hypothetical protein
MVCKTSIIKPLPFIFLLFSDAEVARLLLMNLTPISRYKVGRIEQMESANQAKARGVHSVSIQYCDETPLPLVLSVYIDCSSLSLGRVAEAGSMCFPFYFLESLFCQLHNQICLFWYGTFCSNVHIATYIVIFHPSILLWRKLSFT